MTINERLKAIREEMKSHGIAAYIVPSQDPHQSEYPATRWKSRIWLSGFTGSAGTVVVTQEEAHVWTDGRYFLQAEEELSNSSFELKKQSVAFAPEHIEWLAEHLNAGDCVGVDGTLFALSEYEQLQALLGEKGITVNADYDLIDKVWKDRPALPKEKIFVHDEQFSGASATEKLNRIRQAYQKRGAQATLLTTLDGIAWTLNIRGRDVAFNPVAVCWLMVEEEQAVLFMEEEKADEATVNYLAQHGVVLKSYDALEGYLTQLSISKIMIDPDKLGVSFVNQLPATCEVIKAMSPEILMKAVKNEAELSNMHKTMAKDGAALTRFHKWLETQLPSDSLTEFDLVQKLAAYRSQEEHYFGESFDAIVGFKGNGAIIHYSPTKAGSKTINGDGMLLIDCGGQYLEGTTDITRMYYLGEPTEEEKRNYTLVLKGHIALDTIRFPKGTNGMHLDILARQFLWKEHMNYGHGTGHGIGAFMNVHEGPVYVRPHTAPIPLEPGMIISNEPGFYKAGEHGIRIENLIVVAEKETTAYGTFYGFEMLTVFPIETKLIDKRLLTAEEIAWLNNYHELVYERISPLLEEEEKAWLKEKCQAI
ncbi:aminopeptidase P family protein [Algivirga pacifica]|uniref:Aminopeptidase P family protein n=1 Tax=Algivirga pacifica TaxID=1162670 RepID=A0ABP9DA68_9BACT